MMETLAGSQFLVEFPKGLFLGYCLFCNVLMWHPIIHKQFSLIIKFADDTKIYLSCRCETNYLHLQHIIVLLCTNGPQLGN